MDKKHHKKYLLLFGANLKRIRESKGFTQAQLAIDVDCDMSYISRIELGKISASLIYLKAIADVMEIELKELFEFE